jgi:hypothetical protein
VSGFVILVGCATTRSQEQAGEQSKPAVSHEIRITQQSTDDYDNGAGHHRNGHNVRWTF